MLTPFQAINLVEGIDQEEYDGQVIEAWQYLHDSRIAYELQGFFGRTCYELLQAGVINDGNVIVCN